MNKELKEQYAREIYKDTDCWTTKEIYEYFAEVVYQNEQLQNQVEKHTQENNDLEERIIHQVGMIDILIREKLHLKEEMLQLKDKIKVYENPNDLTNMFMNCDEITKDTINKLNERIGYLERSNDRREETIIELTHEQQLDKYKSVIDKAIEYIEDNGVSYLNLAGQRSWCGKHSADKLLEILRS